ncbi:hypothetical protein KDA08_05670 [Candidatus Saccharibacteria bacterium]|nr:hypothetical protein [Candidatus Saccharibacteria bacterium]
MTDINMVQRIDFPTGTGTLIASGYQGQWLVPGSTYAIFPTSGQAGAFQIWTEGNRDGTVGFTPDTAHTAKLTVLSGKYRARTNRFVGAIGDYSIGTQLTVNAAGDFSPARFVTVSGGALNASVTSDYVYALCLGTGSMSYFTHSGGSTFSYVEYETV